MKQLTFAILMAVLFAACREKDPGPKFDPTGFYITVTQDGFAVPKLRYVLVFSTMDNPVEGQCTVFSTDELPDTYRYQYKKGHLKITGEGTTNEEFADFAIENDQLTDAVIVDKDLSNLNLTLHRIPQTDAFAGKTYKGTAYYNDGTKSSIPISFRFGDGKVSTDVDYTVLNNGVATGKNPNTTFLYVILDEKLAVVSSRGLFGHFDRQP